MVTDEQVRLLFKYDTEGFSKEVAAAKAGMNEKTARKFRRFSKLPSEVSRMDRSWRTRPDPFVKVWPELQELLIVNPGLQAATLMQHLQRTYPNSFEQGQLRTLQRRIKQWRAEHGSAQEVFFEQVHHPGRICASDFTYCNDLGVTINGQPFDHMIYHFVLTYSNWETGNICYSESFESLSEGLQDALWELGGVPQVHRTDSLTAAVPPGVKDASEEFRQRYQGLLKHYGLQGQRINVRQAHENGDCEQRHHRLKVAIRQALMLRGSKDFASREQYAEFLKEVFQQLNASRTELVREEARQLKPLPATRLEACRRLRVRVDRGSTIHIDKNTYSLHSRLIGEQVEARVYATSIEIWYGQKKVDEVPRLRGKGKYRIDYRHVIDWLVRKPGAFAEYRYRSDMFPSSRFRLAYDTLSRQQRNNADAQYLLILQLAAWHGEAAVEAVLDRVLDGQQRLDGATVKEHLQQPDHPPRILQGMIGPVQLSLYDDLLECKEDEDVKGQCGLQDGTSEAAEGPAIADLPSLLPGDGDAGPAGNAQL